MPEFITEIIQRRSLLRELIARDLKVRYQRPTLGLFWTFLSPLLTVAVFYIVFALLLKIKTTETPYILYLMSAVFPWAFFQDSILRSTSSLVENKNLIKESASPQFLIPLAVVLANTITFLPILLIIIVSSAIVLHGLPWQLLFLPFVLILHFLLTFGLSLLFSVMYVKWRDLKYILEPVLMLMFYLTPAFYSISLVKTSLAPNIFKLYTYNPDGRFSESLSNHSSQRLFRCPSRGY